MSRKEAMKVELFAPPDYWRLSPVQKKAICNGCGPGSWKLDLVPDYPLGLPFTEPCNIHDFMYAVGRTFDDKKVADRVFLNNMLRVIEASAKTLEYMSHGHWVASLYYDAVNLTGGPAFWRGKNKPDEVSDVTISDDVLFPGVE